MQNAAAHLLGERLGPGAPPLFVSVPGRVNLIGEHIDYHDLPVLPMAIQRRIVIAFRRGSGALIRVFSREYGEREFEWTPRLEAGPSGDWSNYLKAAAQAVASRWGVAGGIDAAVVSDLPAAAGLSSSTALLTGFALALLEGNNIRASFEELMDILPEGEQFVGTRGGGMDHAAVLGGQAGSALLVHFAPVSASPVPVPADWAFLIAHSMTKAEKSGAVRAEYNARRTAGTLGLKLLGFGSYREAVERHSFAELTELASARLEGDEQRCFLHVAGEAFRVQGAVAALRSGDAGAFGQALNESHESLRDLLRVSCPALDELVAATRASGALGARLTGAGFGGCAVVFCKAEDRERVAAGIVERYYSGKPGFDPGNDLIAAEPSPGALHA